MPLSLHDKAVLLRALHHRPEPLVFVNVWDGASARIVAAAGFPAIATSSAGVAYVDGFPDGQAISRDGMLAHVKVIANVVDVPVTADLEGGYGPGVADAIATTRGAIDAGAVGMNFEDSLSDGSLLSMEAQVERLRAVRRTGDELGIPFVINARTDVYHTAGSDDERFTETVARATAYLAAGADCIFVPFITDGALIGRLTAAIAGPVNVLAGAASPGVAGLTKLGVQRISLGSGPAAHLLALLQRAAIEVRDHGTYSFLSDRIAHADLNELLAR